MKLRNTLGLLAFAGASSAFGQGQALAIPINGLVFNKAYYNWGCTPKYLSTGQVSFAFNAGKWNGAQMNFSSTQDWSGFDCLEFDVQNIGNEAANFVVQIGALVNGKTNIKQASQWMQPTEHYTLAMPVNADGKPYGMLFYPSFASGFWMKPGGQTLDMHQVQNVCFMVSSLQNGTTILLNWANAVKFSNGMNNLLDEFGQRSDVAYLNKIVTTADFAVRDAAEQTDLAANPAQSNVDQYGGYTKINLTATGRFHTQQYNNKWYFVTPAGHPFLKFGINALLGDNDTVVTNRTNMFESLPSQTDPDYGQFYKTFGPSDVVFGPTTSGISYDFYKSNLLTKYGTNWHDSAVARTTNRLLSWGFNSLGNGADFSLMKGHQVPYLMHCLVSGSYKTFSPAVAYWGPIADPFDPNWATAVANTINNFSQLPKNDPWCIGWTIDNELAMTGAGENNGQYGIAYAVLANDMTLPAKVQFVNDLMNKYTTIDALNASWEPSFASWDVIKAPLTSGFVTSSNRIADFSAFCLEFWNQYYSTVNAKLKAVDPNTLYMGSRFQFPTPEAIQAAENNCDVLSFNIYQPSIDFTNQYAYLNTLTKPAFISEFGMGSPDRGMYCGGIIQVHDQSARATAFSNWINQVVDCPNLIGADWHQYTDEPVLGRRLDMENYAFGFVDTADNPQPEMVAAARQTLKAAYNRRTGL